MSNSNFGITIAIPKKICKKDIKLSDIIEDYCLGMSYKQIALKYSVEVKTIKNKLAPIKRIMSNYTVDQLNYFREKKAELLDAVQLKIIEEMANDVKVKKASLKDLATAFEKLHIAGRLERNQSTENVSMKQEAFVSMVNELIEEKSIEQI